MEKRNLLTMVRKLLGYPRRSRKYGRGQVFVRYDCFLAPGLRMYHRCDSAVDDGDHSESGGQKYEVELHGCERGVHVFLEGSYQAQA
jgi:hypothetical protein